MERRTNLCSGRGDVDELFDSVTVVGGSSPDGGVDGESDSDSDDDSDGASADEVVLVSMATQGVLRFDPIGGAWTRHGVGPASPSTAPVGWPGWASWPPRGGPRRRRPVSAYARAMTTLYDFEMNDIAGQDVALSKFRDQVCLVVNVASK